MKEIGKEHWGTAIHNGKEIEEVRVIGNQADAIEIRSKNRFNVDKLRYNFDQGARPNRYTVDFYCYPLGIKLEGLRVQTASLPGRQLETGDFSEYGPTRKLPYNVNMDGQEVSFTFICDSSFADRFIIEAWQSSIYTGLGQGSFEYVDEFGDTQIDDSIKGAEGGSSIHPTFAYYEDYVGEIVVKQITRSDKDSLVYRIHEAYPVSFQPMELSYDSTDELMRFECTFAFRTWDSQYKNPNPVSGINKGRRFIDALLDIKNLRKGGNKSNDTLQRFNDRLGRLAGIFG